MTKSTATNYQLDWTDLAFGSKSAVRALKATFIMAPRDVSIARFKQLIKEYLPKGNVVVGFAKEAYIEGFEGQPQFRTLQLETVQSLIDMINAASISYRAYSLSYFQRELNYILEKITFPRVILVNGSWKHSFHTLPPYYVLASKRIDYSMVSPFASEDEARAYEGEVMPPLEVPVGQFSEAQMMTFANSVAKRSFDHTFQTGVALGRRTDEKYAFVAWGFNRVVPYQGYALHHGATREQHFSPPNDLNYYDTIHAEVDFMLSVQRQKLDLHGTTLFINLLPCPSCARMFTETDIDEFVYQHDHSDGYALHMLQAAGKKVRRMGG